MEVLREIMTDIIEEHKQSGDNDNDNDNDDDESGGCIVGMN